MVGQDVRAAARGGGEQHLQDSILTGCIYRLLQECHLGILVGDFVPFLYEHIMMSFRVNGPKVARELEVVRSGRTELREWG